MAAPFVAGMVASFWSYAPELSAQKVKDYFLLAADTNDLGRPINGSRIANQTAFIKAMAIAFNAKADINVDEAVPGDKVSYTIEMLEDPQNPLAKIEVVHLKADGSVEILAETPAENGTIEFTFPQKISNRVSARLVDQLDTPFYGVESDDFSLLRFIDFTSLKDFAGSGSTCQISMKNGADNRILWEDELNNAIACERFCEIVNPIILSANNATTCGVQ